MQTREGEKYLAQARRDFQEARRLPRTDARREELLKKAALAGNVKAMEALGYACQQGEFGKRDIEQAVRWYLAAAAQGSGGAMGELGDIFAEGGQVRNDRFAAYEWYARGAAHGDPYSKEQQPEMLAKEIGGERDET